MTDYDSNMSTGAGGNFVDWTPTTLAGAAASGDVLATNEFVDGLFSSKGGVGILQSILAIDAADQGVAIYLVFLSANSSIGAEDSAPDIDDTEVLDVQAIVDIASGDWKDLGANRVASIGPIGKLLKAATGTRGCYVAVVNGSGAPTFGASGLKFRFGMLEA
jgi:hypothetical protein